MISTQKSVLTAAFFLSGLMKFGPLPLLLTIKTISHSSVLFVSVCKVTPLLGKKKKINVLRGFCLRVGLFTPMRGMGGGWGSWSPDWVR
jgi:hypothetical protein